MTLSLRRLTPLVVLCCAVLAVVAEARPPRDSSSVVKSEIKAARPDADGKQTVTITLTVEKPWHLYANPVNNKDLVDAQTVVSFGAKSPVKTIKIDYPPGKVEKSEVVGDYLIYVDKVTITAVVQRSKNDDSPLEATVQFQACSTSCLLPAKVKLTAP
jgi:DsbC/DsbD-like thiol-disulfide interchange protein